MKALVLVALALASSGCARVRPWERETLAHAAMQQPPWPEIAKGQQHVFQIREQSQGGYGAGGGGCGCN